MGLRYGQGKYGQFLYAAEAESGFSFQVQIADKNGNLKALLNNEIVAMNWSYRRLGGCDKFNIILKRNFDDFENITAANRRELYDVQIYITKTVGGSSTLYFRGYITRIRPNLRDSEQIIISGQGYGERLKNIQVTQSDGTPKVYSSTTVSGVVTSILNDYVTPNTPITVDTIDTFSTAITSIKFNGSVREAIDKLADIVGAEWGVDRNRKFYFRTPSTSVGFRFLIGKDVGELADEVDYTDVVNKVYVEGGDVSGTPFRVVRQDAASISQYGLREQRVFNSSVRETAIANALGDSVLAEKKEFIRSVRVSIPFNRDLLESSNPLPRFSVVKLPRQDAIYGTFLYGEQFYGGTDDKLVMDRIDYELRDVSLLTTIESGFGKPDLVDQFKLLEFELEQAQQQAGA